jgi:hypothetical protein
MPEVGETDKIELETETERIIVIRYPLVHAALSFVGFVYHPLFPDAVQEAEFENIFRIIVYCASRLPGGEYSILGVYKINKHNPNTISYDLSIISNVLASQLPLAVIAQSISPIPSVKGETSH